MLFNFLPPEFAGGALQGVRLMKQLSRLGVEVTALATAPHDLDAPARERAFGGEVRRFRIRGGGNARRIVGNLRSAWWLLTHSNWDILHVHGYGYYAVLPVTVAHLRGRPVLIKTTILMADKGAIPTGRRALKRFILSPYRRAGAIVALSTAIEDALRKDPMFRGKVVNISNGVDTELFRPAHDDDESAAMRRSFDLPESGFVIVTCGKLEVRKNGLALLEAGAHLRTRPAHLVVAGPTGDNAAHMARVEAAIAALPTGVEAHLLGHVEPDRVPDLLRAADLLTLTSRAEGMPNSLLEGMATQLPCIATDVPGSRDVLGEGDGVLVPLDDIAALAREIDRLLEDTEARSALGNAGHRTIIARYSATRVSERYLALYRELLS